MTQLITVSSFGADQNLRPAQPLVFDGSDQPMFLSQVQKAAVIVQLILAQGGHIPLDVLPQDTQMRLINVFARMGAINKATVHTVLKEFSEHLSAYGLGFPSEKAAISQALDGTVSADLITQLSGKGAQDPQNPSIWDELAAKPVAELAELISNESPQIAAIILSRLDAATASLVVEELPAELAQSVTFAISQTKDVQIPLVEQIAQALAAQSDVGADQVAFATSPAQRAADILNETSASHRDAMLAALQDKDPAFASEIAKAIFTFSDIPYRIEAVDVPKITREMAADDLLRAMRAGADIYPDVAEFIFGNMSKRMAEQLREEMAEVAKPEGKDAEKAMGLMTKAIRNLADSGELTLKTKEEENAA